MLASGKVHTELDSSEVKARVQELITEGITSLAICFLHSYANPSHEQKARQIVGENFPELDVSCSHEITPRIREYERASTTVIDAYVKPIVKNYVSDLSKQLGLLGFRGRFLLMTCTGGVVESDVALKVPVLLLESGPVAGVAMAKEIAEELNLEGVFSFDMGGTTAKGCVIKDRKIEKSYEFEAARSDKFRRGSGVPVSIPVVSLIETGSGGGSIARVDELGLIRVGPQSAGSKPGPACYALGGSDATVTDADLLLGYIDEEYFAGGKMRLRRDLARRAVEKMAKKLGVSPEQAAWAIHERVNEDVATAFRLYASEAGVDYRSYAFVPYGGAGPIHAIQIAKKLGLARAVIPPRTGVLSAEGLLVSPLSVDLAQTKRIELSDFSFEDYQKTFHDIIKKGSELLIRAGVRKTHLSVRRVLDMCYHGQGYDIPVTLEGGEPTRQEFSKLSEHFESTYKRKYTIAKFSKFIDITSFKVTISSGGGIQMRNYVQQGPATPKRKLRRAFDPTTKEFREFLVLSRYSLRTGTSSIRGPALIQEAESTTVIPSESTSRVDRFGNILVKIRS